MGNVKGRPKVNFRPVMEACKISRHSLRTWTYREGCPNPGRFPIASIFWIQGRVTRRTQKREMFQSLARRFNRTAGGIRVLVRKGMPTDFIGADAWMVEYEKAKRLRLSAARAGKTTKGLRWSWRWKAAEMCGISQSLVNACVKHEHAPSGANCFFIWFACRRAERSRLSAERRRAKHERDKAYCKSPRGKLVAAARRNRPKWRQYAKEYRLKNRERINERMGRWNKLRRAENPSYRIAGNLRSRLHKILRLMKAKKCGRTRDLIGCSPDFLKQWIESKWRRGMTWQNYGTLWEIDHIFPLARFDLSRPDQQRMACHYSNLQPLWKTENMAKADRIIDGQLPLAMTQ